MPKKTPSLLLINTDRLLLRSLLPEDATAIHFIRSNNIVNKYIDRPKSITIEDAHNFIVRIEKMMLQDEGLYWGIILKETNELIGTTCYFNIDYKKGKAEIGYELLPDYHGQGIMQEAIKQVIEFGFVSIQLNLIVALVFNDNKKSIQLLEKNYFLPDKDNKYISKKDAGELLVYYLLKNKVPQ